MVKKYARVLEEREINSRTGEVWKISDIGNTWRAKVIDKVENDGYYFAKDGTVYPVEETENEI